MDASRFDWLGNGSYLHLHGAIDDATGKVLALRFDKEETFDAYCELMFQMNQDDHLPKELYTDGRSIFTYDAKNKVRLSLAEEVAGVHERQPQFARAMRELGILLIIARSPQAKGSIERLWGTLQDRLPKDLQRQSISTVDQANAFLARYVPYYNRKFAVLPASPVKAYLPKYNLARLQILLSRHETRMLDSGLGFSFQGLKYTLPVLLDGKKIPASPHDTLTVTTSPRIGIQVIFKGFVMQPVLLKTPPKSSLLQNPSSRNILAPPQPVPVSVAACPATPWHKYSYMFYSDGKKDDILAAHLSTAPHDIFPDH